MTTRTGTFAWVTMRDQRIPAIRCEGGWVGVKPDGQITSAYDRDRSMGLVSNVEFVTTALTARDTKQIISMLDTEGVAT